MNRGRGATIEAAVPQAIQLDYAAVGLPFGNSKKVFAGYQSRKGLQPALLDYKVLITFTERRTPHFADLQAAPGFP